MTSLLKDMLPKCLRSHKIYKIGNFIWEILLLRMNCIANHIQRKADKRIITHDTWQTYAIILGEMSLFSGLILKWSTPTFGIVMTIIGKMVLVRSSELFRQDLSNRNRKIKQGKSYNVKNKWEKSEEHPTISLGTQGQAVGMMGSQKLTGSLPKTLSARC